MIKGIYWAAQSLNSKMKNIDVIANNLANINTTGYKQETPFIQVLTGEKGIDIQESTNFQQGDLTLTSNPLDLAISGKGFFAVETENGIELTRNGKFKVSEEGFLTDEEGHKVLGKNGPIEMDDSLFSQNRTIAVSKNGEIKVGDNPVGTLLIAEAVDSSQMTRGNDVNFISNDGFIPAKEGDFEISQGYLEGSNVSPVLEMEEMIQMNKGFESAYKVMNYLDESLSKANEIGRV